MPILKLVARFNEVERCAALLITLGRINTKECQKLLEEHEAIKELLEYYINENKGA